MHTKTNVSAEANPHRQLLKYCRVQNRQGDCTERFIDHHTYYLWRFLMQQRHHFSIVHTEPCVWIPHNQWSLQQSLFDGAHLNISVSRLEFECYDANSGVTEIRTRFIPTQQCTKLTPLLLQHLCGNDEIATLRTQPGRAISTRITTATETTLRPHAEVDWAH